MGLAIFDPARACVIVIDVQDRLAATMPERDAIVACVSRLVRVAGELGVPVIYTQQYTCGLGPTVEELLPVLTNARGPIEKLSFDCCAEPALVSAVQETGREQIVLMGMEAHICVTQTALHLLRDGYDVQVVADAVCSARAYDRDIALERLRSAGAQITTAEAVIYEGVGKAGTELFRRVLAIVKEKDTAE